MPMGFDIGAYRLVCSNGLIIGKRFVAKKMKHYISCNPEVFKKDMDEAMGKYMHITSKWKEWAEIQMNAEQAKAYLEEENIPEKRKEEILNQFEAQGENNKWMFFNAMTYVITHMVQARKVENTILSQMNYNKIVDRLYE